MRQKRGPREAGEEGTPSEAKASEGTPSEAKASAERGLDGAEGIRSEGVPPITVLSWNVYLRSVAAEKLLQNDRKEQRVQEVARVASGAGADVICFQEACSTLNFRVHRLQSLLRKRGYAYSLLPRIGGAPSRVVDDGLCIFSKLPMRELQHGRFRSARGPDGFMAKGYRVAEIGNRQGTSSEVAGLKGRMSAERDARRGDGVPSGGDDRVGVGEEATSAAKKLDEAPSAAKELDEAPNAAKELVRGRSFRPAFRLVNTHLQSTYCLEPRREDTAVRRRQLEQMVRETRGLLGPDTILAGDLNVNAWSNRQVSASRAPSPRIASASRPRSKSPAAQIEYRDGRGDTRGEYSTTLRRILGSWSSERGREAEAIRSEGARWSSERGREAEAIRSEGASAAKELVGAPSAAKELSRDAKDGLRKDAKRSEGGSTSSGLGLSDAFADQTPPPRTQTCAYGSDTPHERHTCFYPPAPEDIVVPRTLDYIWHGPAWKVVAKRVVEANGASDHHALLVRLGAARFNPPSSAPRV